MKQRYPITEAGKDFEITPVEGVHRAAKPFAIGSVSAAIIAGIFLPATTFPEIFAGISVFAVVWYFYTLKHFAPRPKKKVMSSALFEERSNRILGILQQEGACTVEVLMAKTNFFEKALIPTLKKMLEEGWIEEELEMETGKWYFKISNHYHEIRTNHNISRDLDSRLNELDL